MAQTIYSAALSEADKKRLAQVAQTQGAAAASSLALQMQNTTTPTPQGATTPPTSQGAVTTPTNTGGAVPSWVQEKQQQAQANKALTEQQHQLMTAQSSGNVNTANQIRQAQAQSMQLNPYQAALASATAPTSTLGGRTEDGKYRLSDGRVYDTLQEAVNANAAGTGGNAAGKPMTNGSGFLAADGKPGKITYGSVFGTRVTDAEGNTHWLDPDHEYFKSSNGYIYDATEATDYELAMHGMYRTELGGKTVVMPIPTQNQEGFARNIDKLLEDHIQKYGRAPLSADELYGPDDDTGVYAGTSGGAAPGGTSSGNIGGVTNYPGQPVPGQKYVLPTVTEKRELRPGTPRPTYPSGEQAGSAVSNAPAANPYQAYLDQWSYGPAPEWEGSEYENEQAEILKNAQNMQWTGSAYDQRGNELLEQSLQEFGGSQYDPMRDKYLEQYGEEWQGSEYQKQRDEALRRAQDMQFNYDPNTDPNWQALQKQYRREGDRATQEALAQAAMRTGGLANSYAVTAATQAGDYYASQLSDWLPQLYQDAYNRYVQEYERQLGISDQYAGFDQTEYDRWHDQKGRNLELADAYNQLGQQDYERYQNRMNQLAGGADAYYQRGQTDYNRFLDEYDRQLGMADRYGLLGERDYGRYLDQLGQYNKDKATSYEQYRDARGDYENDRDFAEDVRRNNRDFNEDVRRYGMDYALRVQAQDFDQWYKQQGLSMDQAQMAFDQWYKQQGLSLEHEQMVFDQWYKGQVLGQNQQEIDNDYAYKQGVLRQNQQEIDFDQSYKTTMYQNEIARTDKELADQQALDRAQRYAALGNYGPLAELWGMTEDEVRRLFEGDGMDAEQAYSGGGGGPQWTEPPATTYPEGTKPIDETTPRLSDTQNADNFVKGAYHENGKQMTKGFQSWWPTIRDAFDQGATKAEIMNTLNGLVSQGIIADYEKDIILSKLGIYGNGGR